MTDVIIVVNSGSSSLKFALYPANVETNEPLVVGEVSGIGRKPALRAVVTGELAPLTKPFDDIPADATHDWLITQLLNRLRSRYSEFNPIAAGHRVVHGGRGFAGPVVIDASVREKLGELASLAPLHQPQNLAAIDTISSFAPELPQVACFDTSFHRSQPRLAQLFALPRELTESRIIRFGFHGLSYEFIAAALPEHLGERADGRVIVAHLGNGASMCAMKNRKSIASSMGFTALDGLMMGTRCGSLDPGVVLHLQQENGMSADEVQDILYKKSGLLGVSGISNNMRDLELSNDPHAREAIELFCYRAACEIGSLAAAAGGLDALVFTAGIGENSKTVRRLICRQSQWLGIELDEAANDANAGRISQAGSPVDIHIIPTNEEAVIATSTRALLAQPIKPGPNRQTALPTR